MKVKPLMLLAIAVACGLVAMVGVQQALNGKKGHNPNLVKVIAAAQDIPSGVPIHKEMLTAKELPKSVVPEGAITELKDIEGRALKVKAFGGDMLFEAKLCKRGEVGASSTIPEGYRAFTLEVNSSQAHAGMIQPKDRVDVGFTYEFRPGAGGPPVKKTKTVLEYVEVFAVDDNRDQDRESVDGKKTSVKSISLLVNPKQFELLGHMQGKGNSNAFHLALRNANDKKTAPKRGVDDGMIDAGAYEVLRDMGELVEKGEEPPKTHTPPAVNLGDLNQFLKDTFASGDKPAAIDPNLNAPLVASPPPIPVKNTWKITFYGKEEPRVVEIDLDDPNGTSITKTSKNASDRKPAKSPGKKAPTVKKSA